MSKGFFLCEFNDSFYRKENTCNAMKANVRWTNDWKLRFAIFIFISFLLTISICLCRVVICFRMEVTSTSTLETHGIESRDRRKKETHIDCLHFARRMPCVCVFEFFLRLSSHFSNSVILSHFPVPMASTHRLLRSRVQIM